MENEPSPSNKGDVEPTKEEVNAYVNRLENELTLSAFGDREVVPATTRPEHAEAVFAYYKRAYEKATSFLSGIDPDLTVAIQTVHVNLDDGMQNGYQTPALRFAHKTKPYIRWTMEIEKSDKYIDTELEDIVRAIYNRKAKGM